MVKKSTFTRMIKVLKVIAEDIKRNGFAARGFQIILPKTSRDGLKKGLVTFSENPNCSAGFQKPGLQRVTADTCSGLLLL